MGLWVLRERERERERKRGEREERFGGPAMGDGKKKREKIGFDCVW